MKSEVSKVYSSEAICNMKGYSKAIRLFLKKKYPNQKKGIDEWIEILKSNKAID